MNDMISVRGFVASEVKSSTTTRGTATASFRLGTTERRFDRATNTWVDGNTNWYTVQSFRYLAGHVGCSIKKGQRVLVVGKLRLRQWEHEGRVYHVAEIDAESVGHDLMWGSANFTRMNGTSAPPESAPAVETPGTAENSNEWDSEDHEPVPPEDESLASDIENPDGTGPLLVNTTTGELVGAGV
ncbi:single-stranded DNA-binding protein [Paenarthrobacter aurescens]|uniref:Single-stranded DNA-binding protein n=1 Tax=Paenarthrobacter aurescens TaxID=43663 RepID=A0A4Y3NFA6_PAEAU|nr:single-stranded DNA-binding protein [Paenarthrobacter aurescens]UKA48069.1 single-stranded DNA-binding protein [Arthrobacter sp. FW305-123]MDO6143830.1 single-stranded DNA-binding protein [Paenarthrobacter aurescens]MDO6147677.1 single-stranded DNA-binding protein [Paenarthrobacter aurescens]MDO6158921.1 single-stranded DNA-binding protein [Paenarthrobacter aurescens]MDO6162905.1 single-stranded DNA-binding protein [Paenarthrobacter aurescens]